MKPPCIQRAIAWLTLLALCWSALSPAAAGGMPRGLSTDGYHDVCFGDPSRPGPLEGPSASGQFSRDAHDGQTVSANGHCAWCFVQLGSGAPSAPASLSFALPTLRQAGFDLNPGRLRFFPDWHLALSRAPPTLG